MENCFIIISTQKQDIIFDEEKDIKEEQINMNKLFVVYDQNLIYVEKKTLKKSKFIISISEMNIKEKKINLFKLMQFMKKIEIILLMEFIYQKNINKLK